MPSEVFEQMVVVYSNGEAIMKNLLLQETLQAEKLTRGMSDRFPSYVHWYLRALLGKSALLEKHNRLPLADAQLCLHECVTYHGEQSIEACRALSIVAHCYLRKEKNPEKALETYLQVLEKSKKLLSESHPTVLNTLREIGEVYLEFLDFPTAKSYFLQCLEIAREKFPPEHSFPNNISTRLLYLRALTGNPFPYVKLLIELELKFPQEQIVFGYQVAARQKQIIRYCAKKLVAFEDGLSSLFYGCLLMMYASLDGLLLMMIAMLFGPLFALIGVVHLVPVMYYRVMGFILPKYLKYRLRYFDTGIGGLVFGFVMMIVSLLLGLLGGVVACLIGPIGILFMCVACCGCCFDSKLDILEEGDDDD